MPNPSLEASRLNTNIDLTCAGNTPGLQEAVVRLVLELQRSGFKGDLDILLRPSSNDHRAERANVTPRAPIGGSPGDWVKDEAQMTRGAKAGAQELVWQ